MNELKIENMPNPELLIIDIIDGNALRYRFIEIPNIIFLYLLNLPKGARSRVRYTWGFDIWFGKVPFFKTMLLVHVLTWLMKGMI